MINDRAEQLSTFHSQHFGEDARNDNSSINGHRGEFSDDEVIRLVRGARNAEKFSRLFDRGDTNGYGRDESRADQALLSVLSFYTQDREQLDRLFRQSALCRDKWLTRPDYRDRTIRYALKNLREVYAPDDGARLLVGNDPGVGSQRGRSSHVDGDDLTTPRGQQISIPASPSLYTGRTQGRKPEVVRFSEIEVPGPRRYLLKGLVLAAYVTLLHGDGGVAKSLLALSLSVAVSGGSDQWLGLGVETGPVLYLDFELDAEEQARRVRQLCRGEGLAEPPEELLYISALGHTARDAFATALEACEEHGVKLLVLDSLGPALQGDAEASRDVISFFSQAMEPFRTKGVGVLLIDHQSKLQAGQSYQSKGAFGSVYKNNLARSVIQVEATERGVGTLTLRLRQKKHNFGPLAEPFGTLLTFSEEEIALEPIELGAAELAEEGTLNAADRVRLALQQGPAYPRELADFTGLAEKTVQNALTRLRKRGVAEPTGEVEGRAEQVRLNAPTPSPKKEDAGARMMTGSLPEAEEVEGVGTLAHLPDGDADESVRAFLTDPPEWFVNQSRVYLEQGSPERLLNPLANAVSMHIYGTPGRSREVVQQVRKSLEKAAV